MIADFLINYLCDVGFVYQSLATLVVCLGIKIVYFYKQRKKRYNLFKYYNIPGPELSLIDGILGLITSSDRPHHLVHQEWLKEFGKVYGYFVGDEPSIVVTDPDMLKAIFLDKNKCFTERTHMFMESTLTEGILFASYPRWKIARKVLSPSFNRYNMRGGQSTQFVEESIRLMLKYINEKQDKAHARGAKADIDIHELMKSTALHLISEMAIKLPNIDVTENNELVKKLDDFLSQADKGAIHFIIRFPFLRPILQFMSDHFYQNAALSKIERRLDNVIDGGLAKLSARPKGNLHVSEQQVQVIDTMIKLHHEGKLKRGEVVGNALVILFAGYDTTSTTLTYIFWVLAKHSEYQDRLRTELMAHGIEAKYLEMIINETMRLYPTVLTFTTRLATQTVKLGKWTIPKGTKVVYHNWLMQRNQRYWSDPDKFDPERFREGADIHPFSFGPFGFGDKKCLGYQLALLEMKMITCDIILRYRLKLKSPENLVIVPYAAQLSKPKEKVVIELEKL